MKLVGNDKYILKENRSLNMAQMDSLMNLYQPLLSSRAICLYLTLLNMPSKAPKFDNHNALCTKIKCLIDELEGARIELENFSLLRVYVSKDSKPYLYIYALTSPLPAYKFLKHDIYSRLLMQVMGKNYVKAFYDDIYNQVQIEGIEEVTSVLMYPAEYWSDSDEKDYQKLVAKLPTSDTKQSEIYDYERFLIENNVSDFVVPINKLTKDDLSLINLYGAKYQINKDDMLKIFERCFNRDVCLILRDKFLNACIRSANRLKKIDLKDKSYAFEPLEFVMYLVPQKELGLSNNELDDINRLKEAYNLSVELLNFVIEKTYTNTLDHSLPYNYMEKVAKSIHHAKVKTIEDAEQMYESNANYYHFKTINNQGNTNINRSKPFRRYEAIPTYKSSDEFDLKVDINETKNKLKALVDKGGRK